MSILIKDMEMPESCFECPFMFARRYCRADLTLNPYQGEYAELTGRLVGCPLVYIPPHGDLIEREAVNLSDFEIVLCDGDYKEGLKMLLEKAASAPTIIPAEEGGETR